MLSVCYMEENYIYDICYITCNPGNVGYHIQLNVSYRN